jgi:hypothetical protein
MRWAMPAARSPMTILLRCTTVRPLQSSPVSLGGPWKGKHHPRYSQMTRSQLLSGCLVTFAILGVMFFLGMIVPAIVRWIL